MFQDKGNYIILLEEERMHLQHTPIKKTLEFTIQLAANTFSNFSMMCVVLPIQIKKSTNKATDIDDDLVTVNGFFFRWLKEIDIRYYSDDVRILPINNTISIADYAANQLNIYHTNL